LTELTFPPSTVLQSTDFGGGLVLPTFLRLPSPIVNFPDWNDFLLVSRDLRADDLLFIVTSRLHKKSYHSNMARIPDYVNQYFNKNSFILLHPMQGGVLDTRDDLLNPTLLASVEKLGDVGKTLSEMIKEKG
jgi:hypothetical protein